MLINMKRLIQGIHMVGEALAEPNRHAEAAPAGATADPASKAIAAKPSASATAADLSGFALTGDSGQLATLLGPKYAVLPMAKAALAALVSWGMNETLDRIAVTGLGLQKLPPNIALGHRGYARARASCDPLPSAMTFQITVG